MMSPLRLLIVHHDPSTRGILASMLATLGHRIDEASSGPEALTLLAQDGADLVLIGSESEVDPSGSECLELLSQVRRKFPGIPTLLLSDELKRERTREATLRGANAVLRYPLPASQLRATVAQTLGRADERCLETAGLAQVSRNGSGMTSRPAPQAGGATANGSGHPAASTPEAPISEACLIGDDPSLRRSTELAATIAPTRVPALIVGERGTGKRRLARWIHQRSGRSGPFLEVDCRGQMESALEAEIFGRRGGTPGEEDRSGKVAMAAGGTLYLDDVAALPVSIQSRLARLLRDGEYESIGSSRTEVADCRIIVGATEDLGPAVDAQRFRADLFYAVCAVSLKLQPLCRRGSDIARLAEHFAGKVAIGHVRVSLSAEALRRLESHDWPGNVLELKSVITRAALLAPDGRIEAHHIEFTAVEPSSPQAPASVPATVAGRSAGAAASREILPLKVALEVPERELILEALRSLNWNRQETARVLDINRTTLYKKMKKYGLLYDEPVWAN